MVRRRVQAERTGAARATEARPVSKFYARCLTDTDCQDLVQAAALEGVDAEIAVLRVLIKQDLTEGRVVDARRDIEALCRTSKSSTHWTTDLPTTSRRHWLGCWTRLAMSWG